jgi:hypothetical protein
MSNDPTLLSHCCIRPGEQHEKRIGRRDEAWPEWYAEYMVREQVGTELPTAAGMMATERNRSMSDRHEDRTRLAAVGEHVDALRF